MYLTCPLMGAGAKRKYIPPTVLEAAGEKRPRAAYSTALQLSSLAALPSRGAPALAMTAPRSGGSFSRGAYSQLLGDASNLHSQLDQMDAVRRQKVAVLASFTPLYLCCHAHQRSHCSCATGTHV